MDAFERWQTFLRRQRRRGERGDDDGDGDVDDGDVAGEDGDDDIYIMMKCLSVCL